MLGRLNLNVLALAKPLVLLLLSCCSLIDTDSSLPKDPRIEFSGNKTTAVSASSAGGVVFDSVSFARGGKYYFSVRFVSNGSPKAISPTVAFDGTGYGSRAEDITIDAPVPLFYAPTSSGVHPIILYWNNDPCSPIPSNRILVLLHVTLVVPQGGT